MPEGLGKAGQTNDHTPQEERDTQPQSTTSIVSQEPSEESSQRVEVIKHRTSDDLVGETSPTVVELTYLHGEVGIIVVECWCEVATEAGIGPAGIRFMSS